MRFARKVKKERHKYGLTQQQLANMTGLTKGTIGSIETGAVGEHAPSAQKLIGAGFFKEDVMKRKMARLHNNRMRERDKYRIPNIPDFYEKLDSVCNTDGQITVDINHPTLQELRRLIDAEAHVEKKAYNN